jgi:cytochrome b561
MKPANPSLRYSRLAVVLHWLLALLIFFTFAIGWRAADLPFSPDKVKFLNWHKWAGVSILALSGLRLLWRLMRKPPPLPTAVKTAMPRWQLVAYNATHHLLYVLFFAVPLLGWTYSSARGFPIVWFGVLPLPDLVPVNKELAHTLRELHELAAYGLVGLAVLHAAAALKHQFIDRDGLLKRMWFGRS